MIRMTRLADYAVMVMTHIAAGSGAALKGSEIAAALGLPQPTASKVLKGLSHAGLLRSYRGVKGGYALALAPEDISVAAVIAAVEGPIALTECVDHVGGACGIESSCPTRESWHVINDVVSEALARVSLADMLAPLTPVGLTPASVLGGSRACLGPVSPAA